MVVECHKVVPQNILYMVCIFKIYDTPTPKRLIDISSYISSLSDVEGLKKEEVSRVRDMNIMKFVYKKTELS